MLKRQRNIYSVCQMHLSSKVGAEAERELACLRQWRYL